MVKMLAGRRGGRCDARVMRHGGSARTKRWHEEGYGDCSIGGG